MFCCFSETLVAIARAQALGCYSSKKAFSGCANQLHHLCHCRYGQVNHGQPNAQVILYGHCILATNARRQSCSCLKGICGHGSAKNRSFGITISTSIGHADLTLLKQLKLNNNSANSMCQ